MKPYRTLATLSLFVSTAALAQPYYSEPRNDGTLSRGELRECMYRDESLAARHERIDREKATVDAETDAIARAGARLADELRNLDNASTAAVTAYNARSAQHNQQVLAHNRFVADVNERTARLNGDSARMDASCARSYRPSDRDAIQMERARNR